MIFSSRIIEWILKHTVDYPVFVYDLFWELFKLDYWALFMRQMVFETDSNRLKEQDNNWLSQNLTDLLIIKYKKIS